MIQSFSNRIF